MKKYRNYIIVFFAIMALLISVCFIPINATRLIPIVEKQAADDFGVKVHIEKLILRLGPSLKIKAPIMHIMYEDGQKFAQFNNVKFYVPWTTLIKDEVSIRRIFASDLIVKLSSSDKYLNGIIDKFNARNFSNNPNICLKKYSITYNDIEDSKVYNLSGYNMTLDKMLQHKNYKLDTSGEFLIDNKQYINYDINLVPNFDISDLYDTEFDIKKFTQQLVNLDFHSDIIADLKISNNSDNTQVISGLVNIDNISVLDPEKKSPKSFIYLTFLGNKIGVLSNIYASSDKKVCLDGVINNSKKPEIDLKVKTDKINLSDLYKKIKLLTDYSYFKDINSISGTMIADFNIKGDLNKIKSTGYLKISDAAVKSNGININNIQSDIDFSNNTINIINAVGYVNNAPVMAKGKIDKNIDIDLLMDKVELKHLVPEMFGVKNGIMSLSANISGKFDNIIHKENIKIDNFRINKDNNDLKFDSLKFDSNKESAAYISNIIITPKKTEYIKLPMLKLNVDKDIIKIPEANIFMPNSRLKTKAEILNYNTKNLTFNVNIDGNINSRDLKNIIPYSTNLPVKFNFYGNKNTQNTDLQILLEKAAFLDEPSVINLNGKLENNSFKLDDLSVSSFSGNFSNNFKNNIKGSKKVVISGILDNVKNPVFKNFRIYIPQSLNVSLPDNIAQVKGDLFLSGKLNKPEIVGQLNIQNWVNQYLQLSANNISVDFNKDVVVVNAPLIKLSDSSFSMNSTISTDLSNGISVKNLGIKSKYFNTDTFLMYKDQLLSELSYTIENGKFYSEKAMMTVYGSHLYLSAPSCDFKLKNNILDLTNISSEIFNGKLAGNMKFNIKDESFDAYIQARGVSACPIFDIISTKKDTVSGIMDFDTKLKGNLNSKTTLNGNIKFEARNGHIGTLGKLEHLLYAQNVIADNMLRTSLSVITKAVSLRDTGLFKYLRGDIDLKDGIAEVKMLQSQGPLMSLFIKGQYNPITDYGKLTVLGRVSDEIMTTLGSFGDLSINKLMTMLTGEESNNKNMYAVNKADLEKLPQLPVRNTKEFRSIINGIVEKPSSVVLFNWISYTQKDYRQKQVQSDDSKIPDFINNLPY